MSAPQEATKPTSLVDRAAPESADQPKRGLEAQVELVRARLARSLDALDAKRRVLKDPERALAGHPGAVIAAGGCFAALLSIGVGLAVYQLTTRKARLRRARWEAFAMLVASPEKIAKRPSFARGVLQKTVTAAVAGAAGAGAKQLLEAVWRSGGATGRGFAPAVDGGVITGSR